MRNFLSPPTAGVASIAVTVGYSLVWSLAGWGGRWFFAKTVALGPLAAVAAAALAGAAAARGSKWWLAALVGPWLIALAGALLLGTASV